MPPASLAHGLAALLVLLSARRGEGDQTGALRGASGPLSQILIFDAGSSGTRIHIFNMRLPPGGAHVPKVDLSVRDRQTLKVKPGLSHFARKDDLEGCQQNIERLLEFANRFVPAEHRATTPALLMATAGLRAVSATKADAVLQRVRATLRKSTYRFSDDWADIIKGKEEAGLAWVAANYLAGTFGPADVSSLGVIEMGGGSTQVSFQVGSTEKLVDDDNFIFKTALGKVYHLYAHSYLGFGQDYAQATHRKSMPAVQRDDPCYPVGYVRTAPGEAPALIKGIGDAALCQDKIQTHVLANADAPGRYADELVLRGAFAATENFFYVRKDLSISIGVDLKDPGSDARMACGKPMTPTQEEVAAMQQGRADVDKPNHCFGLSYQTELLRVLKARAAPGVEVKVVRQINGGDVDWALGAALAHFLSHRDSTDVRFMGGGMEVALASVAAVLVLLGLARAALGQPTKLCKSPQNSDTVQPTKLGAAGIRKTIPAE